MLSLSLHKDCSTNHLLLGPDPIVHLQNSINGNELPLDLFNPSLRARPGGDTSGENVIVENDQIIDEIQKEDPDEHLKFLGGYFFKWRTVLYFFSKPVRDSDLILFVS